MAVKIYCRDTLQLMLVKQCADPREWIGINEPMQVGASGAISVQLHPFPLHAHGDANVASLEKYTSFKSSLSCSLSGRTCICKTADCPV